MTGRLVRTALDDGVAVVTLDDPSHRNALSHALSRDLADGVGEVLAAGARVVVLTATSPVFCAGGSVDDLLDPPGPAAAAYVGLHALADCPVPTIAAVGGPAIGAGVSLPVACDVVLAGESARFDPRFLDLAIHPGGGHLWYMARSVGYQGAAAMTLCGDAVSGVEAVGAGLVWRCVPDGDLEEVALALARRTAGRSPALVRRTKASLRQVCGVGDPRTAEKIEQLAQDWSVAQPEHVEAVNRVRDRIRRGG